jgi:hypothetical protein
MPESPEEIDEQTSWQSAGPGRPRLEYPLWHLLDAAREKKSAKQRCERLKVDWQRKDEVLGLVQRGAVIRWLEDHLEVLNEIIFHYSDMQPGSDVLPLPITREWFQYIAPVIEDDHVVDANACTAPERVEIHLYDPPSRPMLQFCSPSAYRVIILFPPNSARWPVSFPPDRVEIHLPDTVQQWQPEDVEAMRDWPVVVFPANTEASWEQARAIAQKLQGVAASVRLIDMLNPKGYIQNELAACELWGFRLCDCQYGEHHLTVGDEHFRNYCKRDQDVVHLEELRDHKRGGR